MPQFSFEKTPSLLFSKGLARIRHIQRIQVDLRAGDVDHLNQEIAYLNQTYVLHLVALWQGFNEDLAECGFEILHRRNALGSLTREGLENAKDRFNTANTQNIDLLFKTALNVEKLSDSWKGEGVTRDQATAVLASVLKARHEVAHTGRTAAALDLDGNYTAMETMFRMACAMEVWLGAHLETRAQRKV